MTKDIYESRIQGRSLLKFYIGLLPRFKKYLEIKYSRYIALKNGATIGESTVIPLSLAKKANSNLKIGSHTSVQTNNIDLRSKVTIGNNVILGQNVEIITASHNIHSEEWEQKNYGVVIEDYVWVATNVLVMPSCTNIGYGAVCGGGSVLVKDVESMTVVSGNPATVIGQRKVVHKNLVVESLLGGDLKAYIRTYKNR
ncbi:MULTISPECIES: acyltransferase [Flavobacterium]|uniref:Acetyltransferase n=1 Tax=Flavobacterium salmonis TaxID=2654844 RepID=A0A6V6YYK9_9FLAO|nr:MULTISPECIES: acyltransferase [Flavobacterium]OOV18762.1 acetyltransferase [Flavobacterium sp. LM4]CAD0004618.1 acetyltransferase [Flavobacterium salmonis]